MLFEILGIMASGEKEDPPPDVDDDADEEPAQPLAKTAANQAAETDKVTDFVQEKEDELDEDTLKETMDYISAIADKETAEKDKRDKELAAVTIDSADVKLIANEFEIDAESAELKLRESKGDVVAALRMLT